MWFRMIPGHYALSALSVITIISSCYAQPETITGTFTVEQPGTDNCLTLEAARPGFDDDRFVASRCREGSTSQKFTVDAVYDEERSQFSLASSDRKCVYVDSLDQLRRSESLCDKNLNYFFAQSASDMRNSGMGGGQGIRIKHWPSEKCLTSSFDSGVNVQVCEPGNTKQKWRVCRSDDTESCLRFFEL